MIHKLPRIGFSDPRFDLFEMPLLCLQIRLNGFTEKISAVSVHRVSQGIERGNFFGFKAKTNRLLLHNFK